MSRSGRNKFIRATRHLKSTQIDERLQMLNEIPTNSTNSIYTDLDVTPTPVEVDIQIPGDVSRAADFDQDDSGTDTTGLFDDDGTILTIEPPGDTSAILGPMISQWYAWGNFTRIGYVRESDRRVVTLATIDGEIADYNEGESGNSLKTGISNSLTQEQVEWFRDQDKRTYYAFYPGPPSGGRDGSGRYPGLIIATSKDVYSTGKRIDQRRDPVDIRQPWALPGLFSDMFGFNTGNVLKKLVLRLGDEGMKLINMAVNDGSIAKVIEAGSKIAGYETAGKYLNEYNKFLSNPYGEGSTPDNPKDLSSSLSAADYSLLANSVNTKSINKLRNRILSGEYSNKTKVKFVDGTSDTPENVYKNSLKGMIERQVNIAISKSSGLDNSLHNNVQVDIDQSLNSGTVVLTKQYVFRPGGSVEKSENHPIGKLLTTAGVDLDTVGAGSPKEFWGAILASSVGLSNSEKYGGVYKSPGMYYKVVLPINGSAEPPKPVKPGTNFAGGPIPNVKESREVLTESRKKIIREVKKPYQDKEEKKEKLKGYRPRVIGIPGTPIDNPMKKIECPSSFKPMEERMWGKYEKRQNARASQERLNQVGEYVLEGGLFWEFLNKRENARKSKNILEFYGELPDKKIVRRENVRNDSILFLVDENGKTETLLQSEYNEMMDERINKQLFAKYLEEQESKRDPLFKRVSQKINPAFDYPNRPSKDGYPDTPPPEMVNGYHPDLVDGKSVANRFNRLDPISAEAMPPTGNPEIDAKVQKARRIKRIVKGA